MTKRLCVIVAALASVAVLAPATAAAKVRLVHVTSPTYPGAYATLVVAVSPARACSIVVLYKSGPSDARGLGTKPPTAGRVTWTWKVGTNTTPGRWPIIVSCGSAGIFRTSFVVT
jgi:hypothetical protein